MRHASRQVMALVVWVAACRTSADSAPGGVGGRELPAADGGMVARTAGRVAPSEAGRSGGGGTSAPAVALAPARGALLGEYYGDGSMTETALRIGREPAIHLVYYAWTDDWTRGAAADLAAGKAPLVNWEPVDIAFEDIVSGRLDNTIEARARGARALAEPFFLDFAAEMNGDEGWGGHDPELYVRAYRHIHDVFVAAGATNVVWAWCPNVVDSDGSLRTTMAYYPGDAYVDWTGVDGYNWGAGDGFEWQSFREVFGEIYPLLAAIGKPILIAEMACDERGGDKAAWIDGIVATLQSDFPMIKGVVWFDVHKERSWQINSSAAARQAYQRFALDPYMNP